MPSEDELLQRIRKLEAQNSELQDRLDMIYSIVAPADEDAFEELAEKDDSLVQIDLAKPKGVN